MVQAASAIGICRLVATPHLRADFPAVRVEELAERIDRVRAVTEADGSKVALVSGAEASLTWALSATEEQLRLASFEGAGHDLLIETPSFNTLGIDRLLYQLRLRGYRITLAHPERTPELHSQPDRVRQLAGQGILLQVNAESLLGDERSSAVRRFARWLCTEGLAHALASDAHRGHGWRPIARLAIAAQALEKLVGPGRAEWMTCAVPAAIIDGAALPPAPEVTTRRRLLRLRRG